jgi:hypothetical protein
MGKIKLNYEILLLLLNMGIKDAVICVLKATRRKLFYKYFRK